MWDGTRARKRQECLEADIFICTLALGPANPRGTRYESKRAPAHGLKEHQELSKPGFKVELELKIVSVFSFMPRP